MELEELIAQLMVSSLNEESRKAKITIEVDFPSMDISVDTENVSSLSELVSYLQYAIIENLKAVGIKVEQAQGSFDINSIILDAYQQPKYLTLNGKSFKEDK